MFVKQAVSADPKLTSWGADKHLDYQEVVHVFLRRQDSSR
jgi:hypothetical protein